MAYNSRTLPPETREILRDVWDQMDSLTDDSPRLDAATADDAAYLDDSFNEVAQDQAAVDDAAKAFNRLTTFHEKVRNASDSIEAVLSSNAFGVTAATALTAQLGSMVYAASQGELILPFDDVSRAEALKENGVFLAAGAAFLGAEITNEIGTNMAGGYARLNGLGEAHKRLAQGATPGAERMTDQLSGPEHDAYRGIIEKAYTVLHNQNFSDIRHFIDKMDDGIQSLVENHQGTTNAAHIEETLLDIEDQLTDAINATHQQEPEPGTPGASTTAPGMA